MRRLREVGRYAVGVEWSDGHDSILPYRNLREQCPCDACAAGGAVMTGAAIEVRAIRRVADTTLFFAWQDGHESLFVSEELRALCRCAHCIGEPDYPITRQ